MAIHCKLSIQLLTEFWILNYLIRVLFLNLIALITLSLIIFDILLDEFFAMRYYITRSRGDVQFTNQCVNHHTLHDFVQQTTRFKFIVLGVHFIFSSATKHFILYAEQFDFSVENHNIFTCMAVSLYLV